MVTSLSSSGLQVDLLGVTTNLADSQFNTRNTVPDLMPQYNTIARLGIKISEVEIPTAHNPDRQLLQKGLPYKTYK